MAAHLTPEAKAARRDAVLRLRAEGRSQRQIAKRLGLHQSQIAAVLSEETTKQIAVAKEIIATSKGVKTEEVSKESAELALRTLLRLNPNWRL